MLLCSTKVVNKLSLTTQKPMNNIKYIDESYSPLRQMIPVSNQGGKME